MSRGLIGVIGQGFSPKCGAPAVVLEGLGPAAGVLQCLAEGEMQVQPILAGDVRQGELALHRGHVGGAEAEGLQVGETPPALAEARLQLQAPAIGGDAVLGAPDGLQRVPQAHPPLGLDRMVVEDGPVGLDGRLVFPDLGQGRGLQAAVGGMAGLDGEQAVDLFDSERGTVLAVEHQGVVVPGGLEARRQLKAPVQQHLRVVVAADAPGHLGQHAQGGHVVRLALEEGLQQPLGDGQPVLGQGGGGIAQLRLVHRGGDLAGVSLLGAGVVPLP